MPKAGPSEQEMAVIVAAIDAVWPRSVTVEQRNKPTAPSWRFSGRTWGPRPAANRSRPTF